MNEEQAQDATTEEVNSLDGQVTESQATVQDTGQDTPERDYEAEIKKLREENAARRLKAKELEKQVAEYKPLADKAKELEEAQKTEEQKLREQLEALKQEKLQAEQQAIVANQRAQLATLAAKAGVDSDVLEFLDLAKFDFDQPDSIIEILERLKPKQQKPTGGAVVNPQSNGTGSPSEADLMSAYFRPGGRNADKAFGSFGG